MAYLRYFQAEKQSEFYIPMYSPHTHHLLSHIYDSHSLQPRQISAPDAPHDPVNHQQRSRARAHLLAPIYAAPRVHSEQATHEARLSQVEHGSIANVPKNTHNRASIRGKRGKIEYARQRP